MVETEVEEKGEGGGEGHGEVKGERAEQGEGFWLKRGCLSFAMASPPSSEDIRGGSGARPAAGTLYNVSLISGYCIRRNGVLYYLDESKWQKFRAPLTWEQRCNLELQTCKVFGEQLQAVSVSFDLDDKLPLNLEEMASLLLASEVAACCTASATVLRRRGGVEMMVRLRECYNQIDFNFRIERAGGPLDNVQEATDHVLLATDQGRGGSHLT